MEKQTEKMVVTSKGVLYSQYKIIYKGRIFFAAKFLNSNCGETGQWGIQDIDGGEFDDIFSSLRELKENIKLL